MKVDISNFADDENIEFKSSNNAQSLDLETQDIKFRGDIEIVGFLRRNSDVLFASLKVFLPFRLTCSRCLSDYDFDLERPVEFDRVIAKNDFIIDLGQDLRTEIILDYPANPVCSEDCKGLCVNCGENLNEGKCKCK